MTRFPDWQSRLDRFLGEHRDDKFVYGTWDCALFVCECILTMTGTDPAASFRGRYRSRAESIIAIREYAGSNSLHGLIVRMTGSLGMLQVSGSRAARGDVALIRRGKRGCSLAIVALNGTEAIAVTSAGLKRIPLSLAICAWRV